MTTGGWAKPDGKLGRYIAEESAKTLNSYREQPKRVAEDANVENDTAGGGYAHRQLFELIQNSADALSPIGGDRERADAPSCARRGRAHRGSADRRLSLLRR